jgi:hypothetical protein
MVSHGVREIVSFEQLIQLELDQHVIALAHHVSTSVRTWAEVGETVEAVPAGGPGGPGVVEVEAGVALPTTG